jgi:endonuclease YncB( thermonuclease family)
VLVKEFAKDRYGRTIGDVLLSEDVILNQEMVGAGLCWWYRKYAPTNTILEQFEEKAREEKRGLWADTEPVRPWDWRQHNISQSQK